MTFTITFESRGKTGFVGLTSEKAAESIPEIETLVIVCGHGVRSLRVSFSNEQYPIVSRSINHIGNTAIPSEFTVVERSKS